MQVQAHLVLGLGFVGKFRGLEVCSIVYQRLVTG